MNKYLIFGLFAGISLLLGAGCGKKQEKVEEDSAVTEVKKEKPTYQLTADSVINGQLRDYFTVAAKEYTLKVDGYSSDITVQFVTKKTFSEKMGTPKFEIQLFDASGSLIGKSSASYSDTQHLIGSTPGEINAIKFDYIHLDGDDVVPVSFKIISEINKPEPEPVPEVSVPSSTSSESSSSSRSSREDSSYDDSDDDDGGSVKSKAKKNWKRVKETSKAAWEAGKEAWKNR